MGSSGKNRKRGKKKKSGRDEVSNLIAAYDSPDNSRETVQFLKEIVNHSEPEIYAMLVECDMDANEALTRLLSQEDFQEVKSKRNKKKEAKEKSMMGKGCEDSNVNADNVSADSREVEQNLKEIVNCSEQETSTMLVKCDMEADKAVNPPLSQVGFDKVASITVPDSSQRINSKQDKTKETKDTSDFRRVGSSNQNGSDHCVDQGGGDKFNSDGTSNVQGIRNHLAGSYTTAGILGPHPSLKSGLPNVRKKRVPKSSGEAVSSSSVPSSRYHSAWGCGTPGQRTMADVVKMSLGLLKESVTKAPVVDDALLPENPVVPNPLSNSLIESAARRDQLQESASVSNQNVHDGDDGGSQLLCDNYNNKNDETDQVKRGSVEHNQSSPKESITKAPVNDDSLLPEKPVVPNPLPNSLIESSAARRDQLQDSASVSNQNVFGGGSQLLCDNYNNKKDEAEQVQRGSFEHNQTKDPLASVNVDQCTQELEHLEFGLFGSEINGSDQPSGLPSQILNEDLSDFAYRKSFRLLSLRDGECQKEEEEQLSITDDMLSMPTSSPLGLMLSVSMTESNRQAMNHHHNSQANNAPSGHYGNMMNYPYSLPTQIGSYNMPPSAFQQHGGSNNNAYRRHSLVAPLPHYRNSDLHQPAVPDVPSLYGSTNVSTYDSPYAFGMLRDNTLSSIFWDEFRSKLSNLQNRGHNVSGWDCYSLFRGHQNQQSPGSRYSQQVQEQPFRRIGYEYERNSRDQQNSRRNPSNQTEQQPRPRNNLYS